MFPYYNEEILNLQYKTIGYINEDIIFVSNSRKRKRFNLFIENLINKNLELIEKIKQQEEEDNNINNYEKVVDSQDDTDETSTQDDVQDIQEDIQENVDNEYERDDTFDKED
jgi:hypothetical protein